MERAGESAQVPYHTVANLMLAGLLTQYAAPSSSLPV